MQTNGQGLTSLYLGPLICVIEIHASRGASIDAHYLFCRIRITPYPLQGYNMTREGLMVQLAGQSGEAARGWRRFVVNGTSIPSRV
jgi:hypothetical protein